MPLINDLSSLKALQPLLGLGGGKDEITHHSSSLNSRNPITNKQQKIKYFETTSLISRDLTNHYYIGLNY